MPRSAATDLARRNRKSGISRVVFTGPYYHIYGTHASFNAALLCCRFQRSAVAWRIADQPRSETYGVAENSSSAKEDRCLRKGQRVDSCAGCGVASPSLPRPLPFLVSQCSNERVSHESRSRTVDRPRNPQTYCDIRPCGHHQTCAIMVEAVTVCYTASRRALTPLFQVFCI